MRPNVPILLLALLLTACQTTGRPQSAVKVTVVSFPAGAVIEIDGEYKGRTPNVIELREIGPHEKNVSPYNLFLYPTQEDGYCMKRSTLNAYDLPSQISFDLTQCQGEPTNYE